MFFNLDKQLKLGKSFQPSFTTRTILILFGGKFIAVNILALVYIYNDQSLLIAPFGAFTVLIFGAEESPLAQTRNLIMGNLLGAISAVFSVSFLGSKSFSCGIAVAIAIAFGQLFRCLTLWQQL